MPNGDIEILNEYIFKSRLFTCEDSMLKPSLFGLTNSDTTSNTKLIDLLDANTGKILDITALNLKMNWNLNFFNILD